MRVLALLLALAAGPALAIPGPSSPYQQMADEMLGVTVQLARNCSGSVVHSSRDAASGAVTTLVLTAKHCTDRIGQEIPVVVPVYADGRLVREETWRGTVSGRYAAHDLAMIRLMDEDTLFPQVAAVAGDVTLYEGETVWAVGHPAGMSRTMTMGILGNLESLPFPDRDRPSEYRRATPAVVGGSSGGPLFHLGADGYEIIGVVSAGLQTANFINLFVPLPAVQDFLAGALALEARRVAALR